MEYVPVWELPIALYLFLAGLGGGAYIATSILRWRHPGATHMIRVGHLIAPIVVAVGLVLLMVDAKGGLLNPWRFALLLHNFGSVMTWGVVFLAAFEVLAIVVAVLDFLKKRLPTWFDLITAVLAFCVCAYTGCLLGVARTFPLWNNALLPILFTVSALSTGMAIVLLAGALKFGDEFNHTGFLKVFHFWLPCIEIVLVASLLFVTASTGDAGLQSVTSIVSGKYAVMFWVGLVIIGLVGPTAVDAKMLFASSVEFEESRKAQLISVGCETGVLIGGLLLRVLIVYAALPVTLVVPYI